MTDVDRILEVLDQGLQRAGDVAYPEGSGSPDVCWRCTASSSTTDVGLCEACHEFMLSEKPRPTPGGSSWVQHVGLSGDDEEAMERVRERGLELGQAMASAFPPDSFGAAMQSLAERFRRLAHEIGRSLAMRAHANGRSVGEELEASFERFGLVVDSETFEISTWAEDEPVDSGRTVTVRHSVVEMTPDERAGLVRISNEWDVSDEL